MNRHFPALLTFWWVLVLLALTVPFASTLSAADSPTQATAAAANDQPAANRPVGGRLRTRWAKEVSPDNVHPEYPRPQLVRKRWQNLNGLWDYAILPKDTFEPGSSKFDGKILVPFPVESELSRVRRFVGQANHLVYQRSFTVPPEWKLDTNRVLLHFGAVDWQTQVYVNGVSIGEHKGGYDAFFFDITDALAVRKPASKPTDPVQHELRVVVWDPTDAGPQPRGKQVAKPEGIWYKPVTGIWQTVWLEPVSPRGFIRGLRIDTDVNSAEVRIAVDAVEFSKKPGIPFEKVKDLGEPTPAVKIASATDGWQVEGRIANEPVTLKTPGFKRWSPDQPQLYEFTLQIADEKGIIDEVTSYFGMRKVGLGNDLNGMRRILLNDEPLFQFGPLDQGWWPDGLYTAPTDEALRYDLEMTKRFGFNMVRKHVKVEPARWYYHCDRLGLLVWQDMPSGDANVPWPVDGTEHVEKGSTPRPEVARRDPSWEIMELNLRKAGGTYGPELTALLNARHNAPCIVAWVPFNEGWGQSETIGWTTFVKDRDPSRIVISASGGNDFGVGDVRDIHFYPQPEFPPAENHRASVLGEYGGLGLPLEGHTWLDSKNWGYRQFKTREELQATYLKYIADLRPMIESHLSAAIYTQTTDVEIEVNGLMTYDREINKLDPKTLADAHQTLYAPLRKLRAKEKVEASVIAHWRFEEGTPGELVPHDRGAADKFAVRDSSGHRNHLYAYAAGNAPKLSANVPAPGIPTLGVVNRGALDDTESTPGATRDLYTDPGRSRTHMDVINTFPFTEFTVEASFQMAATDRDQTLVGEDGKPTRADEAPLQLLVRADGHLAIVAIDRTWKVRTVASRQPIPQGEWRHAAVVCDGETLRLYLNAGKGYELEGESEFSLGLIRNDGTWTVGRGFHAGAIARDAQALIDEVRVSVKALPLESLLWSVGSAR